MFFYTYHVYAQGDAADVIRNAYENVSNKYQDVLRLEASVAELAQMFQDFALIVEQQGELLDQIEHQVHCCDSIFYSPLAIASDVCLVFLLINHHNLGFNLAVVWLLYVFDADDDDVG